MASSDDGSVLAGARPLVIARTFSVAITVLIPLVLARVLSVSEYGTFKQFFLISSTFYLVLGFGIPQSLYYFLPRCAPGERRALLGQTLFFLLLAGGVGGGLIFFGRSFLSLLGGEPLTQMATPMALYAWLLLAGGALEPGLTAQGRAGAAAIAYVISDTARAASFLIPALMGFGLEGALWGAAVFAASRPIASWLVLVSREKGSLFDKELFRKQLVYALPYGGAMLVAMPQQQLHQYAVSFTSSPAAFAIYSVGCFNLPVVDLLYTPTTEMLMYRIGEQERRKRPAIEAAFAFREAAGKLSLAFIPLALGVFSIAPSFLSLLYGPTYEESAPILRVALLTVVLATLPVDGALRAKAKTRVLLFSYLGKIGISVPLVLGFLHWLGPIGAMIGFVSTELIHKGVLLLFASKALVQRGLIESLSLVVPFRELGKAVVAGGMAAAVVLGARSWIPLAPLPSVLLHGSAFWVLYLGVLVGGGVRISSLLGIVRQAKH